MSSVKALAAAVVLPAAILAGPQYFPGLDLPGQTYYNCPVIDSHDNETGTPWQIAYAMPGNGAISYSEAHTTGTTWTKGGDLGLKWGDIIGLNADFSASVSETVQTTITEGAAPNCPNGLFYCSAIVYPGMVHIKGHTERKESCGASSDYNWKEGEFEIMSPRVSAGGNDFDTVQLCVCTNMPHWADDGHPATTCIENCATIN